MLQKLAVIRCFCLTGRKMRAMFGLIMDSNNQKLLGLYWGIFQNIFAKLFCNVNYRQEQSQSTVFLMTELFCTKLRPREHILCLLCLQRRAHIFYGFDHVFL